jgi:prolyl 4-hydroxylase
MTEARHGDGTSGWVLHERPRISLHEAVLDADECAHVIGLAEPKLKRSQVSGQDRGRVSEGRTSSRAWVRHDSDTVTRALAQRIAQLAGLPLENAESMQVIRYGPGHQYRAHFDAYDLSTDKGRRYSARGGQRMVTALAYLTEVESGGETGFPRLGIQVGPRRGRVLVFENCFAGTTERHPAILHEGCPVLSGTKWAFNLWFHERSVG